jgi:hypothetical protein
MPVAYQSIILNGPKPILLCRFHLIHPP